MDKLSHQVRAQALREIRADLLDGTCDALHYEAAMREVDRLDWMAKWEDEQTRRIVVPLPTPKTRARRAAGARR
jgi:hypothetical protein